MSKMQCRQFVQNAWKKDLCSNCFKSREEHLATQDLVRPVVVKTALSVKRVVHKVQGILRPTKEPNNSTNQTRPKRKTVAFPDSLTEIIGYDGGDDFDTEDSSPRPADQDDPDHCADTSLEPDDLPDSEEERALGNLTRANTNFNTITANLTAPPLGPALMLGRAPKPTGNKPTLLVTITPFGSDDGTVPTARRPVDRKPAEPAEPTTNKSRVHGGETSAAPSLGKIVDMPLIASNLIAVGPAEPKPTRPSVTRSPAIKKPDNEKPRITASAATKSLGGVELKLAPIGRTEAKAQETASRCLADLAERKVEGEAAQEKRMCSESRESAGEPDGKADEEVVAEPPALPKSPPPVLPDAPAAQPSFLYSAKPAVPQKPATLPAKVVGSSLASLLSENRAYEYKLSQAAAGEAGPLAHSRSESQLLAAVDRTSPKRPGDADLLFKASVVKTVLKDEQAEAEDAEEDEGESSEASSSSMGEQQQRQQRSSKRRQAPLPPHSPGSPGPGDTSGSSLFARNPNLSPSNGGAKPDCPVVREKEKRERASSCSPKFRGQPAGVCDTPDPVAPEPAPRRNVSLSQDSLAAATVTVAAAVAGYERAEEKQKKVRSKFSLKKFLGLGSRKDVDMTCGSLSLRSDEIPSTPQPKPRLEIIHPLELDGAAVQVVRNDQINSTGSENASVTTTADSRREHQSVSPIGGVSHAGQHVATRPGKPPPPPQAQSLDESLRSHQVPPKTQQSSGKSLVSKSWQPNSGSSASDSIYANLGVGRSGLAPIKPRRTSSMRDQLNSSTSSIVSSSSSLSVDSSLNALRTPIAVPISQHQSTLGTLIPPFHTRRHQQATSDLSVSSDGFSKKDDNGNVGGYCNGLSIELRQGGTNYPIAKRQSDSGALESNGNSSEFKFQPSFARSSSLPYCAGETDADIYPLEGSEDGSRIGRLRHNRRGRSIVHRTFEDNYGAVVVANHKALAQFLDQMNQGPAVPACLRALKSANLQMQDLTIDQNSALKTDRRVFFSGMWNDQSVTVCVAYEHPSSLHVLSSNNEFCLVPIVEFVDTVPKDVVDAAPIAYKKCSEATISIFPRLQVNTVKSFAEAMRLESSCGKDEQSTRESLFVLLQLVSALKSLQARGIEEAPKTLSNFVLCREDKDAYHRLYLLFQGSGTLSIDNCENNEEVCVSLCQCALSAYEEFDLAKKLPIIQELLMREKADTLSQVKAVLEFSLWGPADVALGGQRERELALQRWLDLERATVLHALVRARAQLSVADEYQLLFLVRTSAKVMSEASLLLNKQSCT